MVNESLVIVNEVTKTYEGSGDKIRTVLDRISFDIKRGEVFGLLGRNGAGKTTLIKIILGLTRNTAGQVLIAGVDINKRPEMKNIIGYVPEKVEFYGHLNALETLNFFAELKGVPRTRCPEVLEKVGLTEFAAEMVSTFSKGMTQRVGVAQALLANPQLLILDEPTSGLDPVGINEFKQMIRELNEEGVTILFTSHIMSDVEELVDRIALVDGGQLQAINTPAGLQRQLDVMPNMEIVLRERSSRFVNPALEAGALKAEFDRDTLKVACSPESKAKVLAAIKAAGGEILDLRTKEPPLEEIIVRLLTGEKEIKASV